MTSTFQRDRRIVKTDEFSSVFRFRPTHRTAHFVLYAKPGPVGHARLGVVVAKRFAPRAVTRNTIKRVTREIFRQSVLPPRDCVVRLSAPIMPKSQPATGQSLKRHLRQELQELLSLQRLHSRA